MKANIESTPSKTVITVDPNVAEFDGKKHEIEVVILPDNANPCGKIMKVFPVSYGIYVAIGGYNCATAVPNEPKRMTVDNAVVLIDTYFYAIDDKNRKLDETEVFIWSDLKQEDPTHIINLENAKERA